MRKMFVCIAAVTTLLIGVELAPAAYLIRLRNGNEYATTRYWYKGGQVLFDTYGGVFGVQKSFVSKIERTDQGLPVGIIGALDPTAATRAAQPKQNADSATKKSTAAKDSGTKRAEDDPVVEEFNRLKEKSKQADSMLTSEIRELLNQITAFKNKLSRDSNLFIKYGREFNDIQKLGNLVEGALQARTQ